VFRDSVGFGLTDEIPVAFDFREVAAVDGVAEELAHVDEHYGGAGAAFKHFALYLAEDFAAQVFYQLQELWAEVVVFQAGQSLQFALLVCGADQHEAVPFFEEGCELSADAVFPLDHVGFAGLEF
jgi:hypothetical protein